MILELNSPHSLNLGEDLEYMKMYVKGKKNKYKFHDMRPMFKGVKTGKIYIWITHEPDNFLGVRFDVIELSDCKKMPNGALKFKNYNYYPDRYKGKKELESIFENWKASNPMIHIGNKLHSHLNKANNYTHAYKLGNKTW